MYHPAPEDAVDYAVSEVADVGTNDGPWSTMVRGRRVGRPGNVLVPKPLAEAAGVLGDQPSFDFVRKSTCMIPALAVFRVQAS